MFLFLRSKNKGYEHSEYVFVFGPKNTNYLNNRNQNKVYDNTDTRAGN